MKLKVLKELRASQNYVSGEKLSNKLGVSRTAVWKAINSLRKEGYEIESVTKKGYKLMKVPDKFIEEEILYRLNNSELWEKVHCLDDVDSTNEEAKRLALKGAQHGTIVLSEMQNQGKGRKGLTWISQPGTGIWLSCLLRPKMHPQNAPMVTLMAGLSVCKAIQKISKLPAKIKWPNDIVVNGKKVCGILTEMNTEIENLNYIVVGIGINVNTEKFSEEIINVATSLKLECNHEINRLNLLINVLNEFESNFNIFIKDGDLFNLIDEYKKNCININREVKVIDKEKIIKGKITDITKTGELMLDTGKSIELIRSGNVSVRGFYGYV